MAQTTTEGKAYYILGLTEVFATQLSQEINVPLPNCRSFLLGQVLKYLEIGHKDTTLEDFIEHGILTE